MILSKVVWMRESGSELQRRDIAGLADAVGDLDRAYIRKWAKEVGVEALWREFTE